MAATAKVTWTPAWSVCYDGSRVDEYRVHATEYHVTVRNLRATAGGARWSRRGYDLKFGATRQEAIAKFRLEAERDVVSATEDLAIAQRHLACADALAAEGRS